MQNLKIIIEILEVQKIFRCIYLWEYQVPDFRYLQFTFGERQELDSLHF